MDDNIILKKCDTSVNEFELKQLVAKNRETNVIYFPMQMAYLVETVRKWETASEQSEGLMEWVELHL